MSAFVDLDKHFADYVDAGKLPGWQLAVTKDGQEIHRSSYGLRDIEAGLPVLDDTIWRLASMTKPVTGVIAMTLWEEGVFDLDEPISRWLPDFAEMKVYVSGEGDSIVTEPAKTPITVRQLLSHSSGMTAGFMYQNPVDALYRASGLEFAANAGTTLEGCTALLAQMPLLFDPGSKWGYSLSQEVVARLVEIWTGKTFDAVVAERLLQPLGMNDTMWWVDAPDVERLCQLYYYEPVSGKPTLWKEFGDTVLSPPSIFSGGGGLLGTLDDYVRFTLMLVGGGELDGVRILKPETVELMAANSLRSDLAELGTGGFTETSLDGVGFGLGMAMNLSNGEFYWGGACSTIFWVDRVEKVTAVFMTSLMPSSVYPIRSEMRPLVYAALGL